MVSGARGLDAFTTDKNQFPLMPEFTGICRICMEVEFVWRLASQKMIHME
jgi:hypothetical protein